MDHRSSGKPAIVSVRSVSKYYGDFRALDDVSLDVEEGKFLALLGPSGCGKTTLLRSIAGFVHPEKGAIEIDGSDMSGVPPYRRPVNTVFQSYALFPHMDVAANVAYGPRRHGRPAAEVKRTVDEALELVGLIQFRDRYPAQLSGGQQQRAALARAIANRPRVLLLDEPLAALDLQLRRRMQLELKHMQEKLGITFILVTHDQEEALVMADQISVMNAGRIIQVGTGEEIYRRPRSRFVASFIGESNLIDCVVEQDGSVTLPGEGQRFMPEGDVRPEPGKAAVSVRPEDIAIGAPGAQGAAVVLNGVVREAVFVGNSTRVYVTTAAGNEIVCSATPRTGAAAVSPGSPIQIHWPASACAVVSDSI